MGQQVHSTTQHDRILLVQIRRREITAAGAVDDTDGVSVEQANWQHRLTIGLLLLGDKCS